MQYSDLVKDYMAINTMEHLKVVLLRKVDLFPNNSKFKKCLTSMYK